MKKEGIAERLKKIMDERNLKQVDILELAKPFCETYKVKLGRNDLSQYVNGKVEPRADKLKVLALALDVDEAWLRGYDICNNIDTDSLIIQKQTVQKGAYKPTKTERKLKLLARHLDEIPDDKREKLIKNFEDSIDVYLDALGIPKEDK